MQVVDRARKLSHDNLENMVGRPKMWVWGKILEKRTSMPGYFHVGRSIWSIGGLWWSCLVGKFYGGRECLHVMPKNVEGPTTPVRNGLSAHVLSPSCRGQTE